MTADPQGAIGNAEVALLGLLAEGPRHPWELQKQVEFRDMRSWTDLSQSTIYKQLRSLETRGLVSSAEEAVEGRLRRVYSIAPAGREALQAALLDLLREPRCPKWPVDIATYNVDLVPREEALAALGEYGTRLREAIRCWKRLEEYLVSCGCPTHRLAIARREVRIIEGELLWLAEFTEELEAS